MMIRNMNPDIDGLVQDYIHSIAYDNLSMLRLK